MDRPFNLRHLSYWQAWLFSLMDFASTKQYCSNSGEWRWVFSAHLRAFLVVPVVPPSCCLRLAPLPFPLLPAAIPPLKRRQITFNELSQKHHVDTNFMGTTLPACICVTPQEDFLPESITDFSLVLNDRAEYVAAQNTGFWQKAQMNLCYIFNLPFLVNCNYQYTFWGCDTNAFWLIQILNTHS